MNRGIYPPLAGAITLERRMEILSHNIGNVQTTGFKKDKPVFETILGQTSGPSVAGIDLFPLIGSLPADRSQDFLWHKPRKGFGIFVEESYNEISMGIW